MRALLIIILIFAALFGGLYVWSHLLLQQDPLTERENEAPAEEAATPAKETRAKTNTAATTTTENPPKQTDVGMEFPTLPE